MKYLSLIVISSIFLLTSCNNNQVSADKPAPPIYKFASDSTAILDVLTMQYEAWNMGNIDGFMTGYWNSSKLSFIGSRGVTFGWDQTKQNYKKGYPDQDAMGQLSFDIIQLRSTGPSSAHLIGQFTLFRKTDKPTGYFSLVFEKIEGNWLITSDMTASTPQPDDN